MHQHCKLNWSLKVNILMHDDINEVQHLFLDHMQQVLPTDKFDENITYKDMKF